MHTNGWEIIEIRYSYNSINCKGLSHLEILKSLHVSLVYFCGAAWLHRREPNLPRVHIPPGLPEATQTQWHCAGEKCFRERRGLTFSSHHCCSSESSRRRRMRRNVTSAGTQLMWTFVGQMGRKKAFNSILLEFMCLIAPAICNWKQFLFYCLCLLWNFGIIYTRHKGKNHNCDLQCNYLCCRIFFHYKTSALLLSMNVPLFLECFI